MLLFTIAFCLILITLGLQDEEASGRLMRVWLKACLVQTVLVVIATEGLSLARLLTPQSMNTVWGIISLMNLGWLALLRRSKLLKSVQQVRAGSIKSPWGGQLTAFAFVNISFLLGLNLFTALVAPPNNFDAMTYHMPRVMHWLQNQTVAAYPTHILRQVSISPGASYLVAQFQVLSGGDRYANFVQWLAYLGTIGATSLLTEQLLGAQTRGLAIVVCATIPMAVLQSTTSQTDLVVAFWLACFTYFSFRPGFKVGDLFWLVASLGLAILTKPTAIIFGVPVVGGLGWCWLRSQGFIKSIFFTLCLIAGSLCLSLPTFLRNYNLFGQFLGNDFGTRSTAIGLIPFLSTALKNLYLSLPLPGLQFLIDQVHRRILHLDIHDPALNFSGSVPFLSKSPLELLAPHEDMVGNPVHCILMILAIGLILFHRLRGGNSSINRVVSHPDFVRFLIVHMLGFILFCSLLKWQEWGNRLMLPFFALGTPLIVFFLWHACSNRCRIWVTSLLSGLAIVYALTTLRHPILPLPIAGIPSPGSIVVARRADLYFDGSQNGRQLKVPYQEAVAAIQKTSCHAVGLALGSNDWEYPLWVLLQQDGTPIHIQHVTVSNETAPLSAGLNYPEPCAVISLLEAYHPPASSDWKLMQNTSFTWFKTQRQIWVYGRGSFGSL